MKIIPTTAVCKRLILIVYGIILLKYYFTEEAYQRFSARPSSR